MRKNILKILLRCIIYFIIIGITIIATVNLCSYMVLSKANTYLETPWNETIGTKIGDLKYAEGKFHEYDLYLPTDKKASSLILFIHGGAFKMGNKNEEELWCKYFASKGYVTASANYTLADGETMSNMNLMYNEMLQCVKSIKAECEKRGYNLKEMATSGQSAGGYLALLYAYRAKEKSLLPVKFVFQQTGPATMAPEDWGSKSIQDNVNFATVTTGKTITEEMVKSGKYRELVNEISPAYLLDSMSVPTLSAYGPRDKVVPIDLKYRLLNRLDSIGIINNYIEFPNSGHSMIGDPDKSQEFLDKALEYCNKYFGK